MVIPDDGRATGGLIREQRRAVGLRQEDLAQRAGCSTIYVRMIESGYAPRYSDVIPRIMQALNEVEPGRGVPSSTKTSGAGGGRRVSV